MISAWRRDPYRLFFPVGLVLAWAGQVRAMGGLLLSSVAFRFLVELDPPHLRLWLGTSSASFLAASAAWAALALPTKERLAGQSGSVPTSPSGRAGP